MKRSKLSLFIAACVVYSCSDALAQATSGSHIQYGIEYNSTLQRYEVYYQANSLGPASPATTSTAQVFIVVPDAQNGSAGNPNGKYKIDSFTVSTAYGNGTWAKGDYVNGPVENPTADYFGILLSSTGTTDIEFNAVNTPALLFTFTVPGGCAGNLSVISDTDPFWWDPFSGDPPNSQSLNINNNMDVLFPTTPSTSTWNPGYLSNYTSGTGPCPSPLPVTLLSFRAYAEGNAARLDWQTASEENSDRIEVEHSSNGRDWQKIGSLKAQGTTVVRHDYTWLHTTPVQGVNQYRLREVDLSGKASYSEVRTVSFGKSSNSDVLVYPNPAYHQLTVAHLSGGEELQLVNMLSQVMIRTVATGETVTLDLGRLPAGTYQLIISKEGRQLKAEKIAKQ